jgi:hypothetical protein
VHTHEAGNGGFVNMRYENSGGRQQWVIDAAAAPAPAAVLMPIPCHPIPAPAPASISIPALVPVTTHTTTHHHSTAPMYVAPSFCSWIRPDPAKMAADALAAKLKSEAAANDAKLAKANYEAILAKVHEGKDDEWTRYWADLARYYRDLGHTTEAKAFSEKQLAGFNINNFWGWPKA